MALDESVFGDYAAMTQDAMLPESPKLPINVPQLPMQQQAQAVDPLTEVKEHPIMQFYTKWKGASPEKRKIAEDRLFADVGPVDAALGTDPTVSAEEKANEAMRKIAAQKSGTEYKPKEKVQNRWGKFMKRMDENPTEMLEFMARLMGPRKRGVGGAAHALQAGVDTLASARQRRAAEAKAKLEAAKAGADIGLTKAKTSEYPSKIELNFANAYKAYQDAKTSGQSTKAANVQLLDSITDSLYATGKGTKYATRDEAKIAAQRMISGKASPEEQAQYDYLIENAILGATPEDARKMIQGIRNEATIRQDVEADKAQKTKLVNFVNHFNRDRNKIADYYMTQKDIDRATALRAADAAIEQAGK